MSIRLDAVHTFGRNLKDWCRLTVPLLCLARFLSDRPIDWLLFWMGWRFIRSSSTYLFENHKTDDNDDDNDDGNEDEDEDEDGRMTASKNEIHNVPRYRRNTKLRAATGTSQSIEVCDTEAPIAALPSTLMSAVACYLHPRDLLYLDTVLRTSDLTRREYHNSVGHDIWKCLWYRDYGGTLLRWKISRQAFRRSLKRRPFDSVERLAFDDTTDSNSDSDDEDDDSWLEEQLSNRLDEMAETTMPITTMKDFYFRFGECYLDYILAGKNSIDECYLGLHGHVFDFTHFAEYHPGLIEPILKECGGDATFYFEDLPHSSGARNIARRLCVLVDHSVIAYKDNSRNDDDGDSSSIGGSRSWGLELVRSDNGDNANDSSNLKEVLRSTNTRPLPLTGETQRKMRWMQHIVPRRRKLRRHPTLASARTRFEQEQLRHNNQRQPNSFRGNEQATDTNDSKSTTTTTTTITTKCPSLVTMTSELISSYSPFRKHEDSRMRFYYDPLGQEWRRWCPNNHQT